MPRRQRRTGITIIVITGITITALTSKFTFDDNALNPSAARTEPGSRRSRAPIPSGIQTVASPADLAIRLRRAAFNSALADGDAFAIGALLAPDAVLITGTDSAMIAGRKAQVRVWQREFSSVPRTTYTRTPDAIQASAIEPIAFEHGHWIGVSAATPIASGSYTAKWRMIGDEWVIEAELYLTLA